MMLVLAFPHWTPCPDGNLQGGQPAPVGTKLKQPSCTICRVISVQGFCIKTPAKVTVCKSKNLMKMGRFPKSEPLLLSFNTESKVRELKLLGMRLKQCS